MGRSREREVGEAELFDGPETLKRGVIYDGYFVARKHESSVDGVTDADVESRVSLHEKEHFRESGGPGRGIAHVGRFVGSFGYPSSGYRRPQKAPRREKRSESAGSGLHQSIPIL